MALTETQTLAIKCEQMAIAADDTEFEQVCRDLPPVLEAALATLGKGDPSSQSQLEVARKIEAAVPLAMRDPTAYARSKIVHRYSVIHENEDAGEIDSEDVPESKSVPKSKGVPDSKGVPAGKGVPKSK